MNEKPTQFRPGNPGRPKGSKNKLTREIKERVEWVLELLDDQLEEDIHKLKAADRVRLWFDLQEFVRPKLQRINLKNCDYGISNKNSVNKKRSQRTVVH